MKRYQIEHSEDRLYTSLHDRKLDLTYTVMNLEYPYSSLKEFFQMYRSVTYHIGNVARIAWFQWRKKLV